MKKFSKLFLAIALVVCLTASAVACAKNNDDKSGDEDPSKPGDSDKKGGFEVGNDTGEGYGQIISPRR